MSDEPGGNDAQPPKKDLTGLMDLGLTDAPTEGPDAFEGSLTLEAQPEPQIEAFESLEELSQTAPLVSDDAPPPPPPPMESEPLPEFDTQPPPQQPPPSTPTFIQSAPEPQGPPLPAQVPFTLRVTGALQPDERARIVGLITKEDLGLREVDLEPQFESGRLLIPRISEFAAILLVQAIRGASVDIDLRPSDTFSSEDNQSTTTTFAHAAPLRTTPDPNHRAEKIPLTQLERWPGLEICTPIDVVTASASLTSNEVEAEKSAAYLDLLEALQRELKYKAFYKGADAILNFEIQLVRLRLPSRYRLTLSGSAVRVARDPSNH